jgi:ribose-phosphate pyrophosphokinase
MARGKLKLFSNRSGYDFTNRLVNELNKLSPESRYSVERGKITNIDFADGESKQIVEETVRGVDAYLVQNCLDKYSKRSIQDNFFEMCQTAYALKGAGASNVTGVMPYHPFLRQDKSKGREPITARLAINWIESSGFDNIITSDMHADQIVGFYDNVKVDNLRASNVLIEYLSNSMKDDPKNTVIIAPDAGGAPRSESFAKHLGCRAAQSFKMRSNRKANHIDVLKIAGRVKDKNIIIVDDMIDTGGSIDKLVKELRRKKAKDITVCCTHSIFSNPAVDRLSKLEVEVIGTDTIPHNRNFKKENKWYTDISLAPLFAKAIYNINNDFSVSDLYYPKDL